MGKFIQSAAEQGDNLQEFNQRLQSQLIQLKDVLQKPDFGEGSLFMGAELEMYLIDDAQHPARMNLQLLDALDCSSFQPELNQYNIEFNLDPVMYDSQGFSHLLTQMNDGVSRARHKAKELGVKLASIGILPTLTASDFTQDNMTPVARYQALSDQLYSDRGENFKININGDESLETDFSNVCSEGANTSFQVHMMLPKEKFTNVFNSALITQPFVTALGANSGILLGKRLWDETRIALFKQSLDTRHKDLSPWRVPARVCFGHGYLRNGAWELFAQAVALHPPILTQLEPEVEKDGNALPVFKELSLHMGTIWPWHRPVYDHHGSGHVRIEFRAIPAGPTNIDMVSNAAFAIGLAMGMSDVVEDYLVKLPFDLAEYNFYRAAQYGLNGRVLWPQDADCSATESSIIDILPSLVPVAENGLAMLNVCQNDIDRFMGNISKRIASGLNGATWQKKTLEHYQLENKDHIAQQKMMKQYQQLSETELSISEWECPWKK